MANIFFECKNNQYKFNNIEEYIDDINFCVASFDSDVSNYKQTKSSKDKSGDNITNRIYIKDSELVNGVSITFSEKAVNCNVFIGKNVKMKGVNISLKSVNNYIYIGDNVSLNNVSLVTLSEGDFIIIGEGVSVSSTSNWSTGFNPGKRNNGIIIGDHCLMASEIAIRSSDGHAILDVISGAQSNISYRPIIIEPYCWVGQRTAILKNVRVGACSIISFGAVVTKSCERFSVLGGVPAESRSIKGRLWLRNNGRESKRIYTLYKNRFVDTVS